MLTKSRVIQLLIMLCLLIGLFVWRTIDFSTTEAKQPSVNAETFLAEEKLCDFLGPCELDTPWGAFSLSTDSGKITPENWFYLTLNSDVKNWKVVTGKTVGKTMFMGKIPLMFSSVVLNDFGHVSKAKSMIGACTEDEMVWRFEIIIEVEGQQFTLHYDFLVSH